MGENGFILEKLKSFAGPSSVSGLTAVLAPAGRILILDSIVLGSYRSLTISNTNTNKLTWARTNIFGPNLKFIGFCYTWIWMTAIHI